MFFNLVPFYTGILNYRTAVLLHFADIAFFLFFFFNILKLCGNPVLSKSIGTLFPTFAHLVSLYHIGDSLNISNVSLIIITVRVVGGQWSLMLPLFFGVPWPGPIEHSELTPEMCVLWLLYWPAIPWSLCLSTVLPIFWDTATVKFRQLFTLQWLPSVQVQGRVTCLSL